MQVEHHPNRNASILVGDSYAIISNMVYEACERDGYYVLERVREASVEETDNAKFVDVLVHHDVQRRMRYLVLTKDGRLMGAESAWRNGIEHPYRLRLIAPDAYMPPHVPPIKFGVELEAITSKMWQRRINQYHSLYTTWHPYPGDFRLERDASVEQFNGAELISPPIQDPIWGVMQAVVLYDQMEKQEMIEHPRAGMHVNVSGQLPFGTDISNLEEALYAIGGNVLRYLNSRWAPPAKQPSFHEGHYRPAVLHIDRVEWRVFQAPATLTGFLVNVALAIGVMYLFEANNGAFPMVANLDDKLHEAAKAQFEEIAKRLDWKPGGKWIGFLYDPNLASEIGVRATWHRPNDDPVEREIFAKLPSGEQILDYIYDKLEAFDANVTLRDVIRMGGGTNV